MLRYREFRRFTILFVALVIIGIAINRAAGILVLASAIAFGSAFFVFTKAQYKSIEQISHQIDYVLHGADRLDMDEHDEGGLSILHSEITKMTLRIR